MTTTRKVAQLMTFAFHPWVIFLSAYPLLDVATSYEPRVGYLGFAWIVTVLAALFGAAALYGKRLLAQARREGSWFTVAMVGAWCLFIFLSALSDTLLSDENIFQVGCPLERFAVEPDGGYLKDCFIGYPTRSYVLQALPAQLFGFSAVAANLGSVLLYFPGFILFAYGLRLLTQRSRASDFISAASLALMFQATILLRVIFYHDQTSQPASLALAFVGLVLIVLLEKNQRVLMLLLSLMVFATSMYPAVFAVLALTSLVLLWALFTRRLKQGAAPFIGMGLVVSALAFLQTRVYRNDLRFGVSPFDSEHLGSRVQALIQFVVLQVGGNKYADPILHVTLLVVFLLGLFGWWGRHAFVVVLWMIAVIVSGFFMGGMSPELGWYEMSGMHRSTSIYPVVCALVAYQVAKSLDFRSIGSKGRILALSALLIPAAISIVTFPYPKQPPLSLRMFRLVHDVVPAGERGTPTFFARVDFPAIGELPKHYHWMDRESSHTYFEKTCVPTEEVPKHSLIVTVEDEICSKNPPGKDYHLRAQWTYPFLAQWAPQVTTVKVYEFRPTVVP